jgi:hypothetical protein
MGKTIAIDQPMKTPVFGVVSGYRCLNLEASIGGAGFLATGV